MMPWRALLEISAAVNALMLSITLLLSPRLGPADSRRRLAGFLFCVGWLLSTFSLSNHGWLVSSAVIRLVDGTLSMLAAALFLDYVSTAVGRAPVSRALYVPGALFLVGGLLWGDPFLDRFTVGHFVLIQIVHTILATRLFLLTDRVSRWRPSHLVYLIFSLWSLHAAQLLRLIWPSVDWIFDSVPLVGAGVVLGLTILVWTDSRAFRPSPAREALLELDDVDEFMRAEKPFLDPALTVESLAGALAVSPRRLSSTINLCTGGNFYDYVNRFRVEEAQRFLLDSQEKETSIEAIGLLAGFRARSTFYEVFRRATGQTPAQFRRLQR